MVYTRGWAMTGRDRVAGKCLLQVLHKARDLFQYKSCLSSYRDSHYKDKISGLVQERRNSNANALELRLSFTNPLRWSYQPLYLYNWIPKSVRGHLYIETGTVETLYNTVNFCWSTHKRHSIARPKGRGMGCLLWVQRATYCVDLSKLSSLKYLL